MYTTLQKNIYAPQHSLGEIVNTCTYDIWAYISQIIAFQLIIGLLNLLSTSVWLQASNEN
jgi:hypothetical protein